MSARHATTAVLFAALCLFAHSVRAGIVFTPHLSEYGILPRGAYADHTLIYTSIDEVFDRDGKRIPLGQAAIAPGSTVDATLLLFRYLWVGNLFEHSKVPILKDRDQIFRIIGNLGWQQGQKDIPELSRRFGLTSGGSGLGDVFVLGGIYGKPHHWGPINANGLFSFTTKIPVGEYDQRALLNTGTHYWSYIPQLSGHANFYGRLFLDGTAALQINGDNDKPAYGGLTPTQVADVYNLEVNAAWKFTEHWYADLGIGYSASRGSNQYDQVTLNLTPQPLPATAACNNLNIPTPQCSLTDSFFLQPQAGSYRDRGTERTLLTTSLYYIYRASSVINLRVAVPLKGRGAQIDVPYDVFTRDPEANPDANPISTLNAKLTNVQEASSVAASPFYELRFVYLFWAP
jgi:hypothetical protein